MIDKLLYWRTLAAFCLVALSHPTLAAPLQKCVGKICIGKDALTYRQLKAKFHAVKVNAIDGPDWDRSLCIPDKQTGTSIVLQFSGDTDLPAKKLDGIFLTKEMLCEKNSNDVSQLLLLRTENGHQLGESKQTILESFGEPSRVDNAAEREQRNPRYARTPYARKFGVIRLHYEEGGDSLLFNQFGIDESGVVTSIWLSNSP